MPLDWIHENPPRWDADKARILEGAPRGSLDLAKLGERKPGALLPGEWWRAADGGRAVGYGWMDTTWGDAEILLAVEPAGRRHGIGGFFLDHLEKEAHARGLRQLYNVIPPAHPEPEKLARWLGKHGFASAGDGRLLRAVLRGS
jgi:GNAT superfamily N-acetyltransferase